MIDCPFESILVNENKFKYMNYFGLSYYLIEENISRKIMIPKIKEIIDRLNLHKI